MTIQIETAITAVAVYPDRARVTRGGKIDIEPGTHRLQISELPLTLSPESVRVSGQGTARARMGGVDVRRDFYTETPSASAAELERRIQEIKDRETALNDEGSVLKATIDYLDGLAKQGESYGRGLAYGKISVKESAELLEFLTGRSTTAQTRQRAIVVEKRELARQKAKLERELKQIRNARPRERYTAIIEIEAFTAGDLDLELTYVVSNASWRPLYDLRLTEKSDNGQDENPAVELGYLAQVTQRSGEDWPGVKLILSTARPALSATLPELDPWYIRVYAPPPRPVSAGAAMRREKARAPMAAAMQESEASIDDFVAATPAPEPAKIQVAQAEIGQEGAAVTFTVPQPVDVPSDGSPHKTSVATIKLTPELDYLTAPKLVPAAYRRAKITNDSKFALLPGPVNIFYGQEFVGTTKLKHVAPNESFQIFLGADDRIKVERKLISREVDKRLLGDKRRLRYTYQIEIKNLRDRAEKIVIQDQLPVSGHEDIKIREGEILPPPTKQTDMGILEWEQLLEADQESKLVFEFILEHQRDLIVTGLPEM